MKNKLFAMVAMLLVLSGCGTLMVLLGDNIRYSVSGKIQSSSSGDHKAIRDALVAVECPGLENSVYQNRKGLTDDNGDYELVGYWELQGRRKGTGSPFSS
jgi:hypothetical protein